MTEPVAAQQAFRSALAIEGAESLAAIEDEVRAVAGPLGYDRFVLFSASATQDEVVERIYWVEGDWFGGGEGVDAETYVRRCPVTRHILEAREPFFWTKTMAKEGELYNIVRHPRGPGIHGLQIPVFGSLGLEGAMSLGGQRIDASRQTRLVLALIATTAFFSAHKLLEAAVEAVGSLSDREREVLAWTAAGRRQVEIAATLGLSERTVENHLRRIRKRLGVATTAQAIRVAIRNGEIAG
ncbi:LuxR C-terminal-related transcriptional regulator [Aquamicrobium lusatiense]|uniref:PA1136 family autoinducer-binding transcriptional regulator n=1 Tax=Aquamicrobium lusatiense TaxID=89772 RepID=UPI0024547446|nr:PA1136 family autoinducer-binding transcriptional regulator [Aquamicrobium lusatiense]MDH4992343.1 LuxR C-terminal-related transcriptional regulator [Aquamicrobium lusatiense]